jgi:RNA polymerase sigma factor (TIGR02999 family)
MTETPPELGPWEQSVVAYLRRIAERALTHEAPGHSLQPTLLVNEAYLYLLKQRNIRAEDSVQVKAVGATFIRRFLVDRARRRNAKKRGGLAGRGMPLHISVADSANTLDLVDLNDALEALAREDSRAAQVVELRFFGGLTGNEIADELGISLRTVNTDWQFAKAWLYRVMGDLSDTIKS